MISFMKKWEILFFDFLWTWPCRAVCILLALIPFGAFSEPLEYDGAVIPEGLPVSRAQAVPNRDRFSSPVEYIVVSGGPALRFYENEKELDHDKYFANFIDAGIFKIRHLQAELRPGDLLTWLVYRPGYVTRSKEQGIDALGFIRDKAKSAPPTRLLWFDSTDQLINYLNRGQDRRKIKIVSFDFFGHSNKKCFMFDYSNEYDGKSIDFLHERDLVKIRADIFAEDAQAKSWGCHSGESYSQEWQQHFGFPMIGAVGKTDYSKGGWPVLSSKGGRWVQ
jgi:hypothetical protein